MIRRLDTSTPDTDAKPAPRAPRRPLPELTTTTRAGRRRLARAAVDRLVVKAFRSKVFELPMARVLVFAEAVLTPDSSLHKLAKELPGTATRNAQRFGTRVREAANSVLEAKNRS
ncbi:MAG: hypothetical protein AAF750_06635 [Planctomycetota bacterium]